MNTITQQLAEALRNLLRCSTMKTEWGGTALNCGQKRLTDAIEALAAYDAQQAKAPKFQLGEEASNGEAPRLRYFADGPQGSFFTNDLQLARDLVNLYDKDDDWTITDLENPYGPSNNGS